MPGVTIQFDSPSGYYMPGEMLRARVVIPHESAQELRSVEYSVLWHTLGKGEEDMAVLFFERVDLENERRDLPPLSNELEEDAPLEPFALECKLPQSPLSYDGIIVKICWMVRVRLFMSHGRELVQEAPFQLGKVLPAVGIEE